jgi:hypothetical protein
MNNNFNIGTFNAGNGAVNMGGTVAGDQIGTQTQYINDPEVRGAIADLQTLLTQLQTQHPHVTTETQALAIIDAEFTEIK